MQPSPRPSGDEGQQVPESLLEGFGNGCHGRQLGLGGQGALARGGGSLLGLGRLVLSPALPFVGNDAQVLLLAQRLLPAHLLDLRLRDVADRREEWRRRAGAAAGRDTAHVVVGEDGFGEELQVLIRDVGADAGGGVVVVVVGQGVAPWPTGERAAGIDGGGRVVGSSSGWDFHGGCGAVRPVGAVHGDCGSVVW